jgi:hypothetical protein
MGNLDFTHSAGFSWYCVALMASGIAMLAIGLGRNQKLYPRVCRLFLAVAFFGYGFYLAFIFQGGNYYRLPQLLAVPVLVGLDVLRRRAARRAKAASPDQV